MVELLWGLTAFQLAGLLTHAAVLAIGLGGVLGMVPLPRGRRSGWGLVLMAVAMAVLLTGPRGLGGQGAVAVAHVGLFGVALWLLVGPVPNPVAKPDARDRRSADRVHRP